MSIIFAPRDFSKNSAVSLAAIPTLNIWWRLIAHQIFIPAIPQGIYDHLSLSSARILSSWFSQNSPWLLILSLSNFLSPDFYPDPWLKTPFFQTILQIESSFRHNEVSFSYCISSWVKYLFTALSSVLICFFFNTRDIMVSHIHPLSRMKYTSRRRQT